MATTTIKKKIFKLSEEEFKTLSTTGTLTKDGVTYTYSPSDTIYVTPDASRVEIVQTTGQSTSSVMSQKAVTDELSGKLSNPLIFTNVSATFTVNSDSDYVDFDYKAVLTCQSVTANMLATVIFSEAQAKSGNYALTCVTGTDSVTIYSNDDTSITVPTVIAGVPIEVQDSIHSETVDILWTGTEEEYKAITTKDSDTLYFIVEASS